MSRHVPALFWMLPIVVEFDGFASGVADKSIDQRVLPLARCLWSHGWMVVATWLVGCPKTAAGLLGLEPDGVDYRLALCILCVWFLIKIFHASQ